MSFITAVGGARLCGSGRIAGETYLESGLVRGGAPLEKFLIDPPQPVDPEVWGLSAIGVSTFVDGEGVTHVIDWVGESHYPEVADFIEEGRRKGISRKVSQTMKFAGLSPESRLYLLHPRASLQNADVIRTPQGFACPCGKGHRSQEDCIGLAWHATSNAGPGLRKLAEGETYPVKPPLESKGAFQLAVFMVVPLTCITVIEHPDANVTEAHETKAKASGLPVFVSKE